MDQFGLTLPLKNCLSLPEEEMQRSRLAVIHMKTTQDFQLIIKKIKVSVLLVDQFINIKSLLCSRRLLRSSIRVTEL